MTSWFIATVQGVNQNYQIKNGLLYYFNVIAILRLVDQQGN